MILKRLLKEIADDKLYNYLKEWMGYWNNWSQNIEVPKYIFKYIENLGYNKSGRIYRVLKFEYWVVIIEQTSDYIDYEEFVKDRGWDDLIGGYNEVISLLSPNFNIKEYYPILQDKDEYEYDRYGKIPDSHPKFDPNEIKKIILIKNKNHYISFTTSPDWAYEIAEELR